MSLNLNMLAAQRRAAMDDIFVDHPRAHEAHMKFEFLIEHGLCKANRGKLCLPLIAESQWGKSSIIEKFARSKNTEEALSERRIPVLHVTLEANTTRKGLAQNILEAIEEFGWETGSNKGSETILLQRVRAMLKLAQVQLLVLDEFHHLVHSESDNVANSVGETIKRMLIKGVCPIVLSGVKSAERALRNKQLLQRALPPVMLSPLSVSNPSDLKLFLEFLAEYSKAMERTQVAKNATALIVGDIPACLLEISQGVLGVACNLIKEAVQIMTREGCGELERAHLSDATSTAFVQTGLYSRNPFLHGFAPLKAAA
jgi:hypothetical protein